MSLTCCHTYWAAPMKCHRQGRDISKHTAQVSWLAYPWLRSEEQPTNTPGEFSGTGVCHRTPLCPAEATALRSLNTALIGQSSAALGGLQRLKFSADKSFAGAQGGSSLSLKVSTFNALLWNQNKKSQAWKWRIAQHPIPHLPRLPTLSPTHP